MRKLMFTTFCFLLITCAHAQQDSAFATVKYKLTHISDTTWPENPQITNYILYLGKNLSSYTNYDRELAMSKGGGNVISGGTISSLGAVAVTATNIPASGARGSSSSQAEMIASMGNIYRKLNEGKMVNMEYTYGQLFAVEDNLPEINWTISQDTKAIMGLQCQKATADFRGRTYEAWFCAALPYMNGPWKLNGLPGLIIEASDTKKEVVFSFVGFENLEEKKPIGISTLASKASPKEFKQYKEALEKDSKAMAGSSVTSGGMITVRGTLAIGADGKPPRFRQMNNPIEKETKKETARGDK